MKKEKRAEEAKGCSTLEKNKAKGLGIMMKWKKPLTTHRLHATTPSEITPMSSIIPLLPCYNC